MSAISPILRRHSLWPLFRHSATRGGKKNRYMRLTRLITDLTNDT